MRDYEYDLVLNPDINCKHHHQWFYFEVGVFGCLMFQDLGRVVRRANPVLLACSFRVSSVPWVPEVFRVRRNVTERPPGRGGLDHIYA